MFYKGLLLISTKKIFLDRPTVSKDYHQNLIGDDNKSVRLFHTIQKNSQLLKTVLVGSTVQCAADTPSISEGQLINLSNLKTEAASTTETRQSSDQPYSHIKNLIKSVFPPLCGAIASLGPDIICANIIAPDKGLFSITKFSRTLGWNFVRTGANIYTLSDPYLYGINLPVTVLTVGLSDVFFNRSAAGQPFLSNALRQDPLLWVEKIN